jgi:small subunit ribosomal protein S21
LIKKLALPLQSKIKRFMLIIEVKDTENIDKALKRYKRKFQSTRLMRELRGRRDFTKPSVKRRTELLKAAYRQKKFGGE